MPILNVSILQGYDNQTKQALGQALTAAVSQVIDAHPDAIVVCLNELEQDQYFRGGKTRQAGPVRAQPAAVVRAFLDAMEARDLAHARTFLAPGFSMTFPGNATMTELEQLVEFSKTRYRFVRKTYESFDTAWQGDTAVVHCHGMLSGEALDGKPFEGVRFIDRFELKAGQIVRQQVWNDLAIALKM